MNVTGQANGGALLDTVYFTPMAMVTVALDAGEAGRWGLQRHRMPHLFTGMMTQFAVSAMNITEAALRSDLTAKTIRYHEEIGLVRPQRWPNGYRHLAHQEVRRLTFLVRAPRLDFSLQDCCELLTLEADTHRSSADVRAIASRHLAGVDERLADLSHLRTVLQSLVESCAGDGRPDCLILDALTDDRRSPKGSSRRSAPPGSPGCGRAIAT